MNKSKSQVMLQDPIQVFKKVYTQTGGTATLFIAAVLIALEIFNFSTTKYALQDLLGNMSFGPTTWAAILASAFCGMDLIGIIRLFDVQKQKQVGNEGWFLLGAWLLAAIMNTGLTWWGVSLAIYNHPVESVLVVDPMKIVTFIPIFVALIILLSRIMIIGNLSSTIKRVTLDNKKTSGQHAQKPFGFDARNNSRKTTYAPRRTVPQNRNDFQPFSERQ